MGAPGEVGAPGECEVVEIKIDISLANDEEREAFARAQRARLAKMLGLQVALALSHARSLALSLSRTLALSHARSRARASSCSEVTSRDI